MKTLLLMRHAKSSWKQKDLPDIERPLSSRGEKDAPMMGRMLKKKELIPDLIISSPAVRARQTVEEVAKKKELNMVLDKQFVMYGGRNVTDDVVDSLK